MFIFCKEFEINFKSDKIRKVTLMCVPLIAGMPKHAASIQMETAITIVILVARFPLCEWNFRRGSTIAKKRSPLSAVNVNTDTPILKSLKYSDVTHSENPHGQEFRI